MRGGQMIKKGTVVLVRVKIEGRAMDDGSEELRGYLVKTSRDDVAYINPEDIAFKEVEINCRRWNQNQEITGKSEAI